MGEGSSYEAYCKDLRPSLDWTPESGWKVPMTMVAFLSSCIFTYVFTNKVFLKMFYGVTM